MVEVPANQWTGLYIIGTSAMKVKTVIRKLTEVFS